MAKFGYDVFISHADLDNQGDDWRHPWVNRLQEELEYYLDVISGTSRRHRIWRYDTTMESGSHIDTNIEKGLRESRVLVVVLSNVYVQRPHCLEEFVYWKDNAGSRSAFVVAKEPLDVDPERTPNPELTRLLKNSNRLKFWTERDGRSSTFCDPFLKNPRGDVDIDFFAEYERFSRKVNDLAFHTHNSLAKLKGD